MLDQVVLPRHVHSRQGRNPPSRGWRRSGCCQDEIQLARQVDAKMVWPAGMKGPKCDEMDTR